MATIDIPDQLIPALREILMGERPMNEDILEDHGLDPWIVMVYWKEGRLEQGALSEIEDIGKRDQARAAALRLAAAGHILSLTGGIPEAQPPGGPTP
jgi:hypothetical protein